MSKNGVISQEQFGDMSIVKFSDGQAILDAGIFKLKNNIVQEEAVQNNEKDEEVISDISNHERVFWKDVFK